ncbi:Acetyltransferases [Paenibacillus uliginis N3/975]|uniref:Acetyltransferases n=1 Tax=Paenibacillus uliginis N3/975 TaxID=1313296 RepID=A0A1X7HR23_9BACL|nr:GNAT family N-acetyltransferase [Paenibacillus uliginis]SMF90807.1 Acetyltransferases [Paenibacillus uliginis N3/975]
MEIRTPTSAELELILTLSPQALFEGTLGGVMPTSEKIKGLIEPLLAKGCRYFIAVEGGDLAGWILFGKSKDQFTDTPIGFIYELFVLEQFRGKGYSKQLLSKALDHLKSENLLEVRLSAFSGNHAIKLYEKAGFHVRTVNMSLNL